MSDSVDSSSTSTPISSMRLISRLFVMHTLANSLLLSSINTKRCMFWERLFLTADEKWIANWYAFAHFQVGILIAGMSFGSSAVGDNNSTTDDDDATICYMILSIITTYMAQGIFSMEFLDRRLVTLQLAVFAAIAISILFFTNRHEQNQPRIVLLRKLRSSSSSFAQRKKLAVATLSLGVLFLGSLFRLADMVLGEGQTAYTGDRTTPVYQNISNMALCDVMTATALLGAAIRFFEADQQKNVLLAQIIALLVSLVMLASGQGDMIDEDKRTKLSIGTFISILIGLVGVI